MIGLLFPAVRAAQSRALAVTCASNQRQVGVSILLFLEENMGKFPASYNNGDGRSWDRMIPLSSKADLLLCPADKRKHWKGRTRRTYSMNRGHSNGARSDFRGVSTQHKYATNFDECWSMRISSVKKPAQGIMVFEAPITANLLSTPNHSFKSAKDLANQVNSQAFWIHGFPKSNYLFVDGHVSFLRYMETFLNLRDPWGQAGDVRNTLWDCFQ